MSAPVCDYSFGGIQCLKVVCFLSSNHWRLSLDSLPWLLHPGKTWFCYSHQPINIICHTYLDVYYNPKRIFLRQFLDIEKEALELSLLLIIYGRISEFVIISLPKYHKKRRRGRPYAYPPTVIPRCFIVKIWLRLDSDRAWHDYLTMDYYPYNRKILRACELTGLLDRRILDRRLSTISTDCFVS